MSKRLQNPSLGGPRPCKVWMSVAGSQSKHWVNGVGYSQIPIHQLKVRILPRQIYTAWRTWQFQAWLDPIG